MFITSGFEIVRDVRTCTSAHCKAKIRTRFPDSCSFAPRAHLQLLPGLASLDCGTRSIPRQLQHFLNCFSKLLSLSLVNNEWYVSVLSKWYTERLNKYWGFFQWRGLNLGFRDCYQVVHHQTMPSVFFFCLFCFCFKMALHIEPRAFALRYVLSLFLLFILR